MLVAPEEHQPSETTQAPMAHVAQADLLQPAHHLDLHSTVSSGQAAQQQSDCIVSVASEDSIYLLYNNSTLNSSMVNNS